MTTAFIHLAFILPLILLVQSGQAELLCEKDALEKTYPVERNIISSWGSLIPGEGNELCFNGSESASVRIDRQIPTTLRGVQIRSDKGARFPASTRQMYLDNLDRLYYNVTLSDDNQTLYLLAMVHHVRRINVTVEQGDMGKQTNRQTVCFQLNTLTCKKIIRGKSLTGPMKTWVICVTILVVFMAFGAWLFKLRWQDKKKNSEEYEDAEHSDTEYLHLGQSDAEDETETAMEADA